MRKDPKEIRSMPFHKLWVSLPSPKRMDTTDTVTDVGAGSRQISNAREGVAKEVPKSTDTRWPMITWFGQSLVKAYVPIHASAERLEFFTLFPRIRFDDR